MTYQVDFLSDLLGWLGELLKSAFAALWNFVLDAAIAILDAALQGLASLIAAIPVPSFIASGMTGLFGGLGADITYILSACGFTAALALYGSGWAFRLARKFLTLFQW
jgi:hypothetical protein